MLVMMVVAAAELGADVWREVVEVMGEMVGVRREERVHVSAVD